MLLRLHLRDVVLVDDIELEFGPGFTVLTGETGAGKSILIDALKLALGERGDVGVLRPGAARAEVVAEFDAASGVREWLDEQGYEADGGALLRRVVDAQGRSRAWINGSPATLTQLRDLGSRLVDIHGQHAWQGLTRPDSARELLDAWSGAGDARAECASAWSRWRAAALALEQASGEAGRAEAEREMLEAQVAELDRLAPLAGEWEPLNAEHHRLAHAAELVQTLQAAADRVDDDETGASSQLARAAQALHAAAAIDPGLAALAEQAESALAQLRDLGHEAAAALRGVELDPQRLDEVDSRLSAWMGLARRHRVAPAELPTFLDEARQRLDGLAAAADLPALRRRVEAAATELGAAAARLSALREAGRGTLARAVEDRMQELGMAGGRFEVALLPLAAPAAHGAEDVELRVAGHAGVDPRALGRVASGGELSRIALAIAASSAAQQSVGTLIFDEVDAGIGGAVAHTVGRLLAELGGRRQVLAVTHLAQVAACAARHLQVSKGGDDAGGTHSQLADLDGRSRVAEVARMLGGAADSAVARAHARELLQGAARGEQP